MKTINKLLMGLFGGMLTLSAQSQSWVRVNYDMGQGAPIQQIEGLLRLPEGAANQQALLILHHGGGFSFKTTQQYGEYFSKHGFVTLELKMFNVPADEPAPLILRGQMMGALKYLSQIAGVKHVSAMGLSLGAFMAIDATSNWFYDYYQAGDLRFYKLAALYPNCWRYSEALNESTDGIRSFSGMPKNYLQRFAQIPLLVLAAGKDSYDGLDPRACPSFVKSIPDPRQAELTQVVVYANATHAWDHGRDYSFPVRGGCLGRTNCTNQVVSNPETTAQGKQAVLAFLTQP